MITDLAQVLSSGTWHAALRYSSTGELAAAVREFVEGASDGDPLLVVAAKPTLGVLRERLDGGALHVAWADMGAVGLNPGRLIAEFREFADQHPGRMVWCIQEPVWPGRSREELNEVIRHEALLNLAFADGRVRLLCAYSAEVGDEVVTGMQRTHPVTVRDRRARHSSPCVAPGLIPEAYDRPLTSPPASADSLAYRDQLAAVRRFSAEHAHRAGLAPHRVSDLVLAVSELAANTIAHTNGPGSVTAWTSGGEFICQVDDTGQIGDPLAGRQRAGPVAAGGSRGLWTVHQVCDLVEIRSGPAGTSVRVHMRLAPASGGVTSNW